MYLNVLLQNKIEFLCEVVPFLISYHIIIMVNLEVTKKEKLVREHDVEMQFKAC